MSTIYGYERKMPLKITNDLVMNDYSAQDEMPSNADIDTLTQNVNTIASKINTSISSYTSNSIPSSGQNGYLISSAITGFSIPVGIVSNVCTLPNLSEGTYFIDISTRFDFSGLSSTSRSIEITTNSTPTFTFLNSFKNWAYTASGIMFHKTNNIIQVAKGSTLQTYVSALVQGNPAVVNVYYKIVKIA